MKFDVFVFIELRRFRKSARSVGPGLGARLHPTPVGDVAPTNFSFGRFLKSRWILFGHKFPGPSFGMLAYCNKPYPVGVSALDDIGDLSLNLWRNDKLEFRVRGDGTCSSEQLCRCCLYPISEAGLTSRKEKKSTTWNPA